jgi:hypothetical protein
MIKKFILFLTIFTIFVCAMADNIKIAYGAEPTLTPTAIPTIPVTFLATERHELSGYVADRSAQLMYFAVFHIAFTLVARYGLSTGKSKSVAIYMVSFVVGALLTWYTESVIIGMVTVMGIGLFIFM